MINPDQNTSDPTPPADYKKLVFIWAACCTSPIVYLGVAALIKSTIMPASGWLPLEPYTWSRLMIGLGVLLILLQIMHLAVKIIARRRLTDTQEDQDIFWRLATRRTFILIGISEIAVAAGFCLFLLKGDLAPLFASGIAAMLLYGQSHPKFGLPT